MIRSPRERGSASVELVVLTPAFLMFVALLLFAGRVALAEQAVQAAAGEAARAASVARTADQARADAARWASASLDNQQLGCRTQQVSVDTEGFARPVGTPAQVAATVTCVVDLSDLSAPGVPGSYTVTATMRSPLDTYRSRS